MGAATNETAKKFQKSYFDVLGLCCSSEVPLIENILKSLDGIKHVSVIVPSRTVIVVHDHLLISQIQIVKALNQARLEANVRVVGEVNYKKKWPSPFAMICGVLLVLSFFKYIYHPFQWVALGAVAVGIFPIALKAVAAIRNMRLDINILALVAVIGTIVLKDYLEAATIVFLFTIAEWLESRASHKATAVMSSLMSIAPQKAVIAESGEVVDAEKVKLNTIIAVKAGEIIPIDGIVVEGKCEVDQKTLTGESFPVVKQKDSTVLAGTINLDGYIGIRTTALAEDCLVAKMAKLVEDAHNNKSRTQKFIDKCAKYYTPGVLIMSVCIAAIPAALRAHNQDHWFHLALVVLISACPCALILSTPVATFCALSKAATCGILIKGGDYLEILAKIKIMAFDKTGTITRGEFVVTHFRSLCDDISSNTLLYWVSSIESKSSHPMAAALVDYSRLHSIEPKIENVVEFQNFPGEGICGKIDGKYIYVGNTKISQRAGSGSVPELEGDTEQGKTIGYIYNGATAVGIFKLSDVCRSGVVEAINGLKSLGIKIAMLTGDSHAAAMHAQNQLGNALEVIHAELLPDDKAELIRQFKKEGPTAMIGDGINDAPALATADVGFSMGISGSALATESGHVILMSNDLQKIPKAVRLARKTQTKVIQNVILSITTKAAIVALAIAGHPLVWAAVLADVGTCLLVIFNSMLLLGGTHKHEEHCRESSKTSHYHEHKNCMQSAPPCSRTCGKELHHVEDHGCAHINHVKDCIGDEESGNVGNCMQTTPSSRICVKELHNVENHGCAHNHVKDCIRDEELGSVFEPSCANEPHVHKHICSSTSQPGNKCAEPSVGHEVKHGKEKCSTYKVMTCDKELHNMTNHGCANKHVKGSVGDEELGNVVEPKCCEDREVCCESKENCTKIAPPHNAAIDMAYMACCSSHVETKAVQTCMSFEKREIGGCCKSFRKECCTMHGHFGAAFGGGLSEIITE